MEKRGRAFVVVALLAALVVPAARAGEPQKLSPSEVKTIDNREVGELASFRTVYTAGRRVITLGCPIVRAHPQVKPEWASDVVGGQLEIAEVLSGHLKDLADEVDGFLTRVDAYPDPSDQAVLSRGVSDMAFGLRIEASAVDKYISGLKKAKTFDCAGFEADAADVQALLNKGVGRYIPGLSDLTLLAQGFQRP